MKKIFVFVLAAFLCASVFALDDEDDSRNFDVEDEFSNEFWITNRNIGFGVPIIISKNSSANGGIKDIGGSLSYKEQHVYWPNGFVFQFEAAQGGLIKQGVCYEDNFQIGFGYAFVSNNRAVVTLAGIIGSYDSFFFRGDLKSFDLAITATFVIGLDFSATVRLSEHLGLFISALVETPLIGTAFGGSASNVDGNVSAEASSNILIPGDFFYIKPSIGLSLTFGD